MQSDDEKYMKLASSAEVAKACHNRSIEIDPEFLRDEAKEVLKNWKEA